jgi:hypothetical protein
MGSASRHVRFAGQDGAFGVWTPLNLQGRFGGM